VLALLAGCGGSAGDAQTRLVRSLVPGAQEISCDRDGDVMRCRAITGNALAGKTWTCEFKTERPEGAEAYSGTQSCWTSGD
jgi:hypothetical protein